MDIPSNAEIAQLVEHNLAKVGVASSSLVFRSQSKTSSRFSCVESRFPLVRANGVEYLFLKYDGEVAEW